MLNHSKIHTSLMLGEAGTEISLLGSICISLPGLKILNTIKPLLFIKVFCISLPLGVMHKSVAIKTANIANNRKKV